MNCNDLRLNNLIALILTLTVISRPARSFIIFTEVYFDLLIVLVCRETFVEITLRTFQYTLLVFHMVGAVACQTLLRFICHRSSAMNRPRLVLGCFHPLCHHVESLQKQSAASHTPANSHPPSEDTDDESRADFLLLTSYYGERREKLKYMNTKNKSLWEEISEELKEKGVFYSAKVCETKMKNLKRSCGLCRS